MIITADMLKAGVRCCGPEGCGSKYVGKYTGYRNCIGQACAAFRMWSPEREIKQYILDDYQQAAEPDRPAGIPASWRWSPYEPDEDECAYWFEPYEDMQASRSGYCGLAGPVYSDGAFEHQQQERSK